MKKLSNRHSSLNTPPGYTIRGEYDTAGLSVQQNIPGNGDRQTIDAHYQYGFNTKRLNSRPGLGFILDSGKKLGDSSGMSRKEWKNSGLPAYSPQSGISPYLTVEADLDLSEKRSLTAGGNLRYLSVEIKNRPMVDRDSQGSPGLEVFFLIVKVEKWPAAKIEQAKKAV